MNYRANEDIKLRSTFHVMNVRRPILSVGLLEAAGHKVSFGKMPFIEMGKNSVLHGEMR